MTTRQRYDLFLSIYPTVRGFAYVLAEGPLNPIDWGTTEARGPEKNAKSLSAIEALVKRYRPDALILENTSHASSWRSLRVQKLTADICVFAQDYGIPIISVSREEIRAAFAPYGAETKDEIAEVIAERIPVLAVHQPPVRKPWMSIDARMGLFDAMAQLLAAISRGPTDFS
jgi:Holliday junction resolvasome RuvABC endonuclease subunit